MLTPLTQRRVLNTTYRFLHTETRVLLGVISTPVAMKMHGIDECACCGPIVTSRGHDESGCIGHEEASEDFCMDGNGNGRVDVDDLLLLLANFGKAC